MLFNSFGFLCIIPVVLFMYYLPLRLLKEKKGTLAARTGNAILLGVSYAFFFYNQPVYTLLLFGVTLVTYIFARLLDGESAGDRRKRRLTLITAGAALAALPLVLFKYANFILDLSAQAMNLCGLGWTPQHTSWIVPLGISFFTFQALGYLWDVYYRRFPAERNFADYMLFVAFFPQIASGPISRASDLMPQIKARRQLFWGDITAGMKLLLWGYFLKACFADRVAIIANAVFNNYEYFSGASCFIGSIMYSLQIYGDFAGYSLMAIGVGRMLGFRLPDNFRQPYFAASIGEFWRRWHISLSSWLRDYVYIPLGGNRRGKKRTYLNLMATFLVSGIWHGASLTFVFWGLLHGLFQAVEKFFGMGSRPHGRVHLVLRVTLTFLLVNFAWIFFRMPTFSDAMAFIGKIFTAAPGRAIDAGKQDILFIFIAVTAVFLKDYMDIRRPDGAGLMSHPRRAVRFATYIALLFAILLMGVLDAGQFIYVNF